MLKNLIIVLIFSPLLSFGQGGIIARQLFKPGLKVGSEVIYEGLLQGEQEVGFYAAKAGVTLPIKSKLGVQLKPREWFKLENVKDLWKIKTIPKYLMKVFQPDAHQVFWNFNTQYTVVFGKDYFPANEALPVTTDQFSGILKINTGVNGLHYFEKRRAVFYALDIGFVEDGRSISRLHPNFNLVGGYAKIRNIFMYHYHGLLISYNSGRVLPIPFSGTELRIANKARINVTLPFQAKVSYKKNRFQRYALLVQYNGLAGGFSPDIYTDTAVNLRYNFVHRYLKTTGILEQRLNSNLKLFTEIGWASSRRLDEYQSTGRFFQKPDRTMKLKSSPYAYVSVYYTFGKSLFDSSIGNLFGL